MNIRSAKAKGQRASKLVQEEILKFFRMLTPDDVRVTPSGVNGADIQLSSFAKSLIPFAFEVKNQEKLNIWNALSQAERHQSGSDVPVVVFKRNRSKTYAAIEFTELLKLLI